jgi:hypothetical protein
MKIEKNDPRLTAYVLNELSAPERAEIEKALQTSNELREEVNSLKIALTPLQNTKLGDDGFFSLTNPQRNALFAEITKSHPGGFQKFVTSPWGYVTAGLMTASFALIMYSNNATLVNQPAQLAVQMDGAVPEGAAFEKDEVPQKKEATPVARLKSKTSEAIGAATTKGSLGAVAAYGGHEGHRTTMKVAQQKFKEEPVLSALAESTPPPPEPYTFSVTPELTVERHQSLQNKFLKCLETDTELTFNWSSEKRIYAIHPNVLTNEQKTCLDKSLQDILKGKTNVFVFKFKSAPK